MFPVYSAHAGVNVIFPGWSPIFVSDVATHRSQIHNTFCCLQLISVVHIPTLPSYIYIYIYVDIRCFCWFNSLFIPIYSSIWWSDMMHIIICIDRSALFHTQIPGEKIWVKACGGGLREATAFRYYSEPLLVGDAAGAAVKILVDDHRGYWRLLYYQWIG